ncbi:hypothetical protein M0813_17780 [Anaeramoeba flamelloides]|uniref:Uncharacterized protein n=1 Tax=Anaeramoeba flamelloides TaxID=1746091 RepID=A0ABQ8YU36_9EUKA|nr:hypothetical protein M0813_17780 [Anaeramoeba flamelloides]
MKYVNEAKTDLLKLYPHLLKIQPNRVKSLVLSSEPMIQGTGAIFLLLVLSVFINYFVNTTLIIVVATLFNFWFPKIEASSNLDLESLKKQKIWIKYALSILFVFPLLFLRFASGWIGYVATGVAHASLLYEYGWRLYSYFGDRLEELTKAK